MGANDAAEKLASALAYVDELKELHGDLQKKYVRDTDILFLARKAAERERDAALAAIEAVRVEGQTWADAPRGEIAPVQGVGRAFLAIIAGSSSDALAEHDAKLVTEFMEQPEFKAMLEGVKQEAAAIALEEAAAEAEIIIGRGDVAEHAGFPPGTTGLREAISLRDSLHEEPADWLRERAANTRTPGEEDRCLHVPRIEGRLSPEHTGDFDCCITCGNTAQSHHYENNPRYNDAGDGVERND